ncbi:hypothetical protein SAMD00019534_012520 [Acytostelium subglobosum LB1]|uniref:hypothetical protein n=1 Tax=Acytostelium subglobosum LB1 TaxID=1410327 RepID=UPI000644EE53|nr:hypothetical protein SAMD00019534_012520 [Acytostelium subglobosum LB1]GAM18077.1 hypothetical protein SAMD00019534_012520 [Acytostelium subglobosum LB1]|eukprot:XP_012758673.1 hypothetical protein SAMD00019534_012520 [Acytostelium subglobosum LB1]
MEGTCCEETHKDSHYSPGYYWLGNSTHKVPLVLHKENRARLITTILSSSDKDQIQPNSCILFQGGKADYSYDSDHEPLFLQEKFFFWAFGCDMPDCYGTIELDNAANPTSTLFIPQLPAEYATWLGQIHSKEYYKKIFLVDHVEFVGDMAAYLKNKHCKTIYTVEGFNHDSHNTTKPMHFSGINEFTVNNSMAFPHVVECRVIKTPKELEVLRYAVESSCHAHMQVMKKIRPGQREYQCESVYLYHAYHDFGCRNVSYTCICAANTNSAVLHYGHAGEPNAAIIRDGSMCLFDMGSQYHGYCADVTCSFPANGKFTDDQKIVYNAVLDASRSVLAAMKPGVDWVDMHKLAERRILSGLLQGGILTGGTLDELVENKIGSIFFPHGLGHFLGLNTHDVGGFAGPDAKPKINSLRTTRNLKEGMFITVEPGCYFIDHLLETALADPAKAKFINKDVLARFRRFGGVRIEDDVLVTATGSENYSKMLPRTVEEIEAYMKH